MERGAETGKVSKPWPSLTENRAVRLAALFLLYFAQGIPVGLCIIAIPAWLAAGGATPEQVGFYVSAVVLPWAFKLINGMIMDRWTYLPMGRRRSWLLGSQILLFCNLLAMILADPGDQDLMLLMILGFCMNVAVSFQDVAVDGMAVDIVPAQERGKANGVMFGGQKLGIALTSAVAGFALVQGGPALAAAIMAGVILIVVVLTALVRERPGEKLMPWTEGRSSPEAVLLQQRRWLSIFKGVFEAFLRPTTTLFAIGVFAYGIARGIMEPTAPTLAVSVLGWESAQYSAYYGVLNIAVALMAVTIVGPFSDKIGAGRAIFILLLSQSLIQFIFAFFLDLPSSGDVFYLYLFLYVAIDLSILIVICAWVMDLCNPSVSSSQFAMFLAIISISKSVVSSQLGNIISIDGYRGVFLFSGVVFLVSMVLMLVARVGHPEAAFQQQKHQT